MQQEWYTWHAVPGCTKATRMVRGVLGARRQRARDLEIRLEAVPDEERRPPRLELSEALPVRDLGPALVVVDRGWPGPERAYGTLVPTERGLSRGTLVPTDRGLFRVSGSGEDPEPARTIERFSWQGAGRW